MVSTFNSLMYRFYNVDSSFCSKQQSSTDIWLAVCAAVKAACSKAEVAPTEVKGMGFAATCSLGML